MSDSASLRWGRASGGMPVRSLAEAIAELSVRRVLDIGGSSGIYLCSLIDRSPGIRGAVFERSPVDVAARKLLAERGYAGRVDVVTGDMFSDRFPDGYDLHLLSHVLHDWDEASVHRILAGSFATLAPGGWLVDHDVHIDAGKTGPPPGGGVLRVPHARHAG
jgi:predicted O-methyltransferase YrrM